MVNINVFFFFFIEWKCRVFVLVYFRVTIEFYLQLSKIFFSFSCLYIHDYFSVVFF